MTADVKLFLDVDGVINAYDGKMSVPSWGWPRETARVVRVRGFGIVYSPEMVARLKAVTELDHVQPHWLTTWEAGDAVRDMAAEIGIGGDWPIVYRPQWGESPWWKLSAIQSLTEGWTGKVVWVDDELQFQNSAREWLRSLPDNLLAICPASTTGITTRQMKRIEEFVR